MAESRFALQTWVEPLAVTRDGLPVRSWVFPGQTKDDTTIARVKQDLKGWRLGRCVFVGDSGMNSEENRHTLSLGGGKYILKQAARRYVPAEVIDRPKGYFPVPSLRYLRGPFLSYVADILLSKRARARGVYDPAFIDYMLKNPEAEMSPKGHSRLWQAAVLEAWLQAHAI